jgi:hypothetical protein
MRLCENRMLRRTLGTKKEEVTKAKKIQSDELHNF